MMWYMDQLKAGNVKEFSDVPLNIQKNTIKVCIPAKNEKKWEYLPVHK